MFTRIWEWLERRKKGRGQQLSGILFSSVLSLFFLITSSKEKGKKSSVYKGWERREKRRRRKISPAIITFCEGSRTMRFFFSFSVVRIARNANFMGIEEGWRGRERGKKRTLWTNPQGPVIGYFILFSEKIKFCQLDDRLQRSQFRVAANSVFADRRFSFSLFPLSSFSSEKQKGKRINHSIRLLPLLPPLLLFSIILLMKKWRKEAEPLISRALKRKRKRRGQHFLLRSMLFLFSFWG